MDVNVKNLKWRKMMNQMQMNDEQMKIVMEASDHVEALFNVINRFVPTRDCDNAASRFEEGFSWLQKVIGTGEIKIDTLPVPKVLDENKEADVA
jgi:hypothetical protein